MRTRRLLESIDGRLAALLESIDGRLAALLEGIDGGFVEMTEELRSQHREHELTRAAIFNVQQVNREILLELRDHRTILESIDHGVETSNRGLVHVLDELRDGRGGPGTAPAV